MRGWVTGFFDRTSLSCRKTGRIHAATLRAIPPPTRRVIRGPLRAKSRKPSANAKAQLGFAFASTRPSPRPSPRRGEGEVMCIGLGGLLWERTWARQTNGAVHPSVASRAQVRSHKKARTSGTGKSRCAARPGFKPSVARPPRGEAVQNGKKPSRRSDPLNLQILYGPPAKEPWL